MSGGVDGDGRAVACDDIFIDDLVDLSAAVRGGQHEWPFGLESERRVFLLTWWDVTQRGIGSAAVDPHSLER